MIERWLVLLLAFLLLDLTPTVSVIELLYTLPAAYVTVRYGRRAILALRTYRRYTRENQPLTLRLRERIRLRRFLSLAVIAEFLLGLGALAMLQPPTIAAETWQPIAVMGAVFCFGALLVLGLKGEVVDRDEHALAWLYQQQVQQGLPPTEHADEVQGCMADWRDHAP